MKNLFVILFIIVFFMNSLVLPSYAYTQMTEFLCEIGIKFYQQGRYDEALHEFKKALMVQAAYGPALKYIQMIQQRGRMVEKKIVPLAVRPVTIPPPKKVPLVIPKEVPKEEKKVVSRVGAVKEMLDFFELEKKMISQRQLPLIVPPTPLIPTPPGIPEIEAISKKVTPVNFVRLDESLRQILQSIEIQQGENIIVIGKNIQRFLVTQPQIIEVEKSSPDELLVTGKNIGYTYLHIWDDNGRWTLEFLGTPIRPEGLTLEEELRLAEEKASTFKLRYILDWYLTEQGRRIDKLDRQTYAYAHLLDLKGPTPYGNFDSTINVRRLKTTTDFTYVTLGLTEGKWGPFKDFTLRGFDYAPGFSNLAYRGLGLRGAMLESPAFNKKTDYTLFWGREGGGRYGNLSPGLAKIKDSFLGGLDFNYYPSKKADYGFSIVHGWGRARENYLNPYSYDLDINYHLDKLDLGYEVSHDTETFGHLINAAYAIPKLKLTAELRDIDKDFMTMNGYGWRRGELGGLFNLNTTPTEKINISSLLNIFQDRLWPALDNDNRWNQDYDCRTVYAIDSLTSLGLDYNLQNELGRLSQFRSQSAGLGLSRTFDWKRRINTFMKYQYRESTYFTSHSSDYINDKIYMGLRFNLISDLYYYLNKEFNWLEERYTGTRTRPEVLETGIGWYGQIPNTPLGGNLRLIYRDEENTISNLSFLSGEDYLEGYVELNYRPKPETELYCSTRVRNIWADNPNVNKRIEFDFRGGLRYLWDTGLRWESVGNVEGYVFKDLNSDGLRQRDEPPIEGIKLWLGKDKFQVSDIFGYYEFKRVRARKAYVTFDTSTLPSGFVLTVPLTQEVAIAYNRSARVDFGVISRSEIGGLVFEDLDGNGQYSSNDKGIQGAVIILEDGSKAITDITGRYTFAHVSVGEHTIDLDLNSLPIYYLPQVAITKKITLFEGVSYIYNIPLKRIKE